jgi:hypothetical protein
MSAQCPPFAFSHPSNTIIFPPPCIHHSFRIRWSVFALTIPPTCEPLFPFSRLLDCHLSLATPAFLLHEQLFFLISHVLVTTLSLPLIRNGWLGIYKYAFKQSSDSSLLVPASVEEWPHLTRNMKVLYSHMMDYTRSRSGFGWCLHYTPINKSHSPPW